LDDRNDLAHVIGVDSDADVAGMPLRPADSPLRPLLDPRPPDSPWVWSVGRPEVAGRLRLPAAAKALIGVRDGQSTHVRGVCHQVGLVVHPAAAGARLRIDGHGRLTLPVWLRDRGPLAIGSNRAASVVVIAPTAVLDPVGDLLAGIRR
jgi:hypothetical protein